MKAICAVLVLAMMPATSAYAQDAAKPAISTKNPVMDFPGLGEIMTLQQLRHIKLWFAGHGGNWLLAGYEIDELKEGFDDVNKLVGGDTVERQVGGPVKALERAVADKSHAEFDNAFDSLSAGCNSCHHALGRGFIVIQRPTLLPYSNQNFAPQK